MKNSRQLTAKVLQQVLQQGLSLTSALAQIQPTISETKDRAFIQALSYGILRDYSVLTWISEQLLAKPLRNKDFDIQLLILVGLYQLRSTRVQTHAAVAETVAAADHKSWAKAVVNAVLRQYLRQQSTIEQNLTSHTVVISNHPQWLLTLIQQNWAEQATELIRHNQLPPPMSLRVNRLRCDRAQYAQLLDQHSLAYYLSPICDTAIELHTPVAVEQLPNFAEGWVSVQDTAAQLAVALLNLQPNQRVLDLCAAPGGKSAAILEAFPSIKLTAIDHDPLRLARIYQNCQRLQLTVDAKVGDGLRPEEWWDGQLFDRILLDAPCSALGVIRRHPDIKWLRRPNDLIAIQQLQWQLLTKAWSLLKIGGEFVYATCSIHKAENEKLIQSFLIQQSNAIELPIIAEWGIATSVGRQILTGQFNMDGFYYARLKKRD